MSELDDLIHAAALASDDSHSGARAAVDALPWLVASLADDRAHGRFDSWGLSTVVDEHTASPVLPRPLFTELHDRAGLSAEWPIGNAGLLHVYGYLLSLAETPYGLKRERWLGDDLAQACGLDPSAFLPWTPGPTLLQRATAAASALLLSPESLDVEVDGRATRTALAVSSGPGAVAYAVAPTPRGRPLLVTMFPVSDSAAVRADATADARLRWNAV